MPENTPRPDGDHLTRDNRVTTDDAAGAEARSFQTRPGDVQPVNGDPGAQGWPLKAGVGEQGPGAPEARPGRSATDDPAKGADAEDADMANDPDSRGARS